MLRRYYKVLLGILVSGFLAGSTPAQIDSFGSLDTVYIDSVVAGPGEDVPLRVYLFNDEPLGSLSIPITYDPEMLTLISISFSDSRAEHLDTKIVQPAEISQINGHFVVALVQVFEDPIAPGDGPLLTALFRLSDSAAVGAVGVIDSLFFPPGGELILVEEESSTIIRPYFKQGKVVVGEGNRAPAFTALPDQYVMEGDSLDLTVVVVDPDSDKLTLAVTSKPSGATFVDNGDGSARFVWVPEFIGPNSADGSPFAVGFWASDGDLSAERQLSIEVVNKNRPPAITAPEEVTVEAGEELKFTLTAFDPDFEPITWSWSGLPPGAAFDGDNPGELSWTTAITETGSFDMEFVAADPQGLSDTVHVSAAVTAVSLYSLSLDSVAAYPGEDVDFNVILDNKFPVSSFNILFHYDPSALSLLSLSNLGTRSESFEYFSVVMDDNDVDGNVRILGVADIGSGTPALDPGDGPIAFGRLHISGDLAFAGMSLPLPFLFLDVPTNDDNTLTDSIGARIEQTDIQYSGGQVMIFDIGQIMIGDINLNGLPAEIGDVIYFTNYFINPSLYSFNALQYANSDVNHDNIAATVSDLVALINWVVNGISSGKSPAHEQVSAGVQMDYVRGVATFTYDAEFEMGAALTVFKTDQLIEDHMIGSLQENMAFQYRQEGRVVNVLLYSLDGVVMPSGRTDVFAVTGIDDIELNRIELGSADGRHVQVAMNAGSTNLPSHFALEQNYPNPFNPRTSIEFSLPELSQVELVVYDVLGRRVKKLSGGEFPAGRHVIVWDGTDENNQAVASGVYLYRLNAGSHAFARKMMLLK